MIHVMAAQGRATITLHINSGHHLLREANATRFMLSKNQAAHA